MRLVLICLLLIAMNLFFNVKKVLTSCLVAAPFLLFCPDFSRAGNVAPGKGIYDGKIGSDQLITVLENKSDNSFSGYFVQSRGKAVEASHSFVMTAAGRKWIFQSDLYAGKLKKATVNDSVFSGTLSLHNRKKFLFFSEKVPVAFVLRHETKVAPTDRYWKEQFPTVEVRKDLLYAKAKGYWTESPYSDEPYVNVLAKGLVRTFDDPELLDLKLDVYYPKGDFFKSRPLVMLIHGGAFYIGSKESVSEKELATALAKRGYVVASINYRLGFKPYPDDVERSGFRAVQDAHAALRYLSYNAKGLGIDPTQVYVGGTSAGAIASLNLAFMDNDERPASVTGAGSNSLGKIESSGNKYTDSFQIKAVANMWGAVADLNIIDRDERIPVLSIHGTADDIVPYSYDYPFQNSLLINRLIMNKMYGSSAIRQRLNDLGIPNKLVSLKGLGHEPELDNYKTLNHYMDTIVSHVSSFFARQTAPSVFFPQNQQVVQANANIKPLYFEVSNGSAVQLDVTGGLKVNGDPLDSSIIWLKDADKRQVTIWAKNKFEAWNSNTFDIQISQ